MNTKLHLHCFAIIAVAFAGFLSGCEADPKYDTFRLKDPGCLFQVLECCKNSNNPNSNKNFGLFDCSKRKGGPKLCFDPYVKCYEAADQCLKTYQKQCDKEACRKQYRIPNQCFTYYCEDSGFKTCQMDAYNKSYPNNFLPLTDKYIENYKLHE